MEQQQPNKTPIDDGRRDSKDLNQDSIARRYSLVVSQYVKSKLQKTESSTSSIPPSSVLCHSADRAGPEEASYVSWDCPDTPSSRGKSEHPSSSRSRAFEGNKKPVQKTNQTSLFEMLGFAPLRSPTGASGASGAPGASRASGASGTTPRSSVETPIKAFNETASDTRVHVTPLITVDSPDDRERPRKPSMIIWPSGDSENDNVFPRTLNFDSVSEMNSRSWHGSLHLNLKLFSYFWGVLSFVEQAKMLSALMPKSIWGNGDRLGRLFLRIMIIHLEAKLYEDTKLNQMIVNYKERKKQINHKKKA
ncbi:uncharacterized protein LOC122255993 [Penaeus japonicus]|uniref:uncharacterized protein LOC122255993 n=1 Tax=Penaeus japonicus TaxID=27405 RepID=UPI001C70DFC2|nr:uncharacterized protein LOC122255993 [Penaeus japonicus]